MAGAIIMVTVLLVVFPVMVLMGGAVLTALLGGFLKAESDASNRSEDGPNEYLQLARKEAETDYPRPL
ncbi:MAG: hypothetical protein OXE79_05825 [Acidimicrobiaceae bacterium]|nr:hypothetical protein [Acidimicrobiaceae bacterium]MCY4176261.1 hypothetical protein [Acidimicrobiaceae bacterium]MCY4280239.1 hypothetical protein [Acidimicrobiaceae bacterium]MCY4293579.1 hypothetical protein [Acidimicrobiaceae bacterium]